MVANFQSRKVKLIAFIAALQQEEAMNMNMNILENIVQQLQFTKTKGLTTLPKAEINHFKRPIREDITVEDLVVNKIGNPLMKKKWMLLLKD